MRSEMEFKARLEELRKEEQSPPPPPVPPGFFTGIPREAVKGTAQGLVDTFSTFSPFGGEYTPDPLKKNTLALDPEQTGIAGQFTHTLMHGVSAFTLGARIGGMFGPHGAIAGGSIATAFAIAKRVFEDLRDEGVDKTTAFKTGVASGSVYGVTGVVAAGVAKAGYQFLSFFNRNRWMAAGSGAGSNVITSIADKSISAGFLERNGYDELAKHVGELDKVGLAADIVLGGAFGAWHYKSKNKNLPLKPLPSERDAAMGAKTDIMASQYLNEGIQVTNEASQAHLRSFEAAKNALEKGEDFHIDPMDAKALDEGSLPRPTPALGDSPYPVIKAQNSFERRMETLEKFTHSLGNESSYSPHPYTHKIRRDIAIVKRGLFEEAFACFLEKGGR